jgi:hypothetical protein
MNRRYVMSGAFASAGSPSVIPADTSPGLALVTSRVLAGKRNRC